MIGFRGCYRYVREPELFGAGARGARARARERPEPAPDDPVRAHGAASCAACQALIDASRLAADRETSSSG